MTRLCRFAVLGSLLTLLAACADGRGTAPQISDVTLDKTEISVGKLETINVTIAYEDADGDVAQITQQLVSPSGTTAPPASTSLDDTAGQTKGSKVFVLELAAPAAGKAGVVFWLTDAKENESPKVTRTISAR